MDQSPFLANKKKKKKKKNLKGLKGILYVLSLQVKFKCSF